MAAGPFLFLVGVLFAVRRLPLLYLVVAVRALTTSAAQVDGRDPMMAVGAFPRQVHLLKLDPLPAGFALVQIADYFNVSIDYLLCRTDSDFYESEKQRNYIDKIIADLNDLKKYV